MSLIRAMLSSSSSPSALEHVSLPAASPKVMSASADQLKALSFVPSQVKQKGAKTAKGRNNQRSVVLGNDCVVPWVARPRKAMTEIEITAFVPPRTSYMTSSTTLTVYGSTYFTFSDLPHVSSYGAIFDEYWIREIELLLVPQVTETTSASGGVGILASAVDFDDANTPSTMEQVGDKEHAIESGGNTVHYHKFSPKFALATYSGAFTSFSPGSGWVDCASPNVQHYGLKSFITPNFAVQSVALLARYTIRFRGLL